MKTLRISAMAAACAFLSSSFCQATLLVYEGYNGYSAALLNGQTPTNTTGFSSATITGGGTLTVNSYHATGLTFSNLVVSGGSGRFHSTNSGTNAQSYIGYTYNGPTVTGTLYTAYLTNIEAAQSTGSIVSMRVNANSATGSGTSYFVSMADSQNGTGPGSQYDAISGTTHGTPALALNTTYLVIGRYTNVGVSLSATDKGVGTTFVLTAEQFDHFKAGGFTDTELDEAAVGTGPTNVYSRVTDADVTSSTHASYPSGFNQLTSGKGIQFAVGNAGSGVPQTAKYDEIRYGTSLDDVLPLDGTSVPGSIPVSITLTDAIATEPTAAVPSVGRVTLNRLDSSTQAVTVSLAVTGTATSGSDYFTLPASLTLPENVNSVTLEVRAIGDRLVESDETVIITIVPGSSYAVDSQNSATVTIQDGPFVVAPTKLINNLMDGKAQTIVVFGTSLTQGGAWSSQMKTGLDAFFPGKTTLLNTTGSGRNSKWGIANVATEVIAKNPDTVFIEFAVNDAVIRTGYQDLITPAQARINLNAIIDAILAARPECEIILQVMSPVVNGGDAATVRPNLALCQQTYRDVGKERGLLVIDHMPSWQTLLDQGEAAYLALVTDGLHPPSSGYSTYVTPVILREIGTPRSTANNSVMLNATNHRAAEPPTAGGVARTTRITVTRNGIPDSPMVVPLAYGGTATNGVDYATLPASITIPAGASSASLELIPLSDNNVEGVETFTVAITSGTGITLASPSKASLIIEDRPFDQWRKSKFSASDLNDPLISGDLADPDQDGFPNLLEFFTGHGPKSRDTELATRGVETIGSSDYLTLTYQRVPGHGLTGIPQVSSNLIDWNEGPTFIQETILSDDGLIQTVKARSLTPMGGDGKEFIRLKTTRSP